MIPSSAMLTTPDRSDITPPSAASVSGVAVISVWLPKMARSSGRMLKASKARSGTRGHGLALGDGGSLQPVAADAEEPADDLRGRDEHDHRRLHDRDQVRGDLGL